MVKKIVTFRVFYCLRNWLRTNGGKWTGQMVKQMKNIEMDKWTNGTNGGQMGGQMGKIWKRHRFGGSGTNGRAYNFRYAPHLYLRLMPRIGEPSGN